MATQEQQKKTNKAIRNAKAIAKQNAIPARIGVQKGEGKLVHGKVQKVKAPKDREKAEIKRNSSQQIISYTRDSKSEYGVVKLDGLRNDFVRSEYHRTFKDRPTQFVRNPKESTAVIQNLNSMTFESPDVEIDDSGEEVFQLQFSGEIIRVGSEATTYFYIEDGKFYTVGGLFNFLAEKLGKPLGMRINDDYDYQKEYKPAGREQLDYGQNQYNLYNKEINDSYFAWTPFLMTAAKGQLEVMKYLVTKGANITYTHPITSFNALHHAAFNGHKAMVDYLVEIGIDKTKNLKGDVSIIRALNEDGKGKMAEYLLTHGFKDEGCQEKRCF